MSDRLKSSLVTLVGLTGFPLLVLLPFMLHSSGKYFIIASSGKLDCVAGGQFVKINQCMSWDPPFAGWIIAFAGLVGLFIWGLMNLCSKYGERYHSKQKTRIQLVLVILVTVITAIIYALMRSHSESQIYGASYPDQGWIINNPPAFGYGLTPVQVVLLSATFIISPLMAWYRAGLSRAHISGIKKKELFQ